MKLPNGDRASVNLRKLSGYSLNSCGAGKHKARVFASALGMNAEQALLLRSLLLDAAKNGEAAEGEADEFGQRYMVDFEVAHAGRTAVVRSAWIIDAGKSNPRLTTCYVL